MYPFGFREYDITELKAEFSLPHFYEPLTKHGGEMKHASKVLLWHPFQAVNSFWEMYLKLFSIRPVAQIYLDAKCVHL